MPPIRPRLPEPYWKSPCGNHVLYHGDCLKLLPLLGKVDAVVTDPPYGLGMRTVAGGTIKNTQTRFISDMQEKRWDDSPPSKEVFDLMCSMSVSQIIWGGNYFPLPPTRCVLVWDKLTFIPTMSRVEIAWTSYDCPAKLICINSNQVDRQHPTQKPVALLEWCVSFTEGKHVLDPFTGSGTTGVACIRLGRKFTGIEIEEKYCKIAAERMQKEWDRMERLRLAEEAHKGRSENSLFQ